MKNPNAQALGKAGGTAGRGAAKARTREQCQAAARARWANHRLLELEKKLERENNWLRVRLLEEAARWREYDHESHADEIVLFLILTAQGDGSRARTGRQA